MNPRTAQTFQYDVFLSHSAKDKAVVRPLAERLRQDGLKVWFDEWVLKPGDSIPAKIEAGLEHSRVLVLCMSAHAFGSDWVQLEAGTFRFRDPLNQERRFIPLRLDDAPIKGSLAQFLYINWRAADREQEYAKLLAACQPNAEVRMFARGQQSGESDADVALLITQKDRFPLPAEILQINALELCARLKAIPPLQEEEVKKHYRGLWVNWRTTLSAASTSGCDSGLCRLQLLPEEPEGYTTPVECAVKLADYPILKVLQRGARLRVLGQIEDFRLFSVQLKNAKLDMPQEEKPTVASELPGHSPPVVSVATSNDDPNRRLTRVEINKVVNRYIGVNGGYLGDFNYQTHQNFYLDLDLDIDPYNYEGTTRERFIKILSESPADVQARILEGVLERFPVGSSELRTQERRDEVARWISRLKA